MYDSKLFKSFSGGDHLVVRAEDISRCVRPFRFQFGDSLVNKSSGDIYSISKISTPRNNRLHNYDTRVEIHLSKVGYFSKEVGHHLKGDFDFLKQNFELWV